MRRAAPCAQDSGHRCRRVRARSKASSNLSKAPRRRACTFEEATPRARARGFRHRRMGGYPSIQDATSATWPCLCTATLPAFTSESTTVLTNAKRKSSGACVELGRMFVTDLLVGRSARREREDHPQTGRKPRATRRAWRLIRVEVEPWPAQRNSPPPSTRPRRGEQVMTSGTLWQARHWTRASRARGRADARASSRARSGGSGRPARSRIPHRTRDYRDYLVIMVSWSRSPDPWRAEGASRPR